MLKIDRQLLQIVFDTATSSLDFGSGFLDQEEVEALRAIAVILGADPMDATPENFRAQYCPGHEWTEWAFYGEDSGWAWHRCEACRTTETEHWPWVRQRTHWDDLRDAGLLPIGSTSTSGPILTSQAVMVDLRKISGPTVFDDDPEPGTAPT
ncbi:MAG: hypothetical protein FJ038_13690 [Chloroflexi bacterium]|nr:hypothetical protein [Chloroflexota bacterium]